MDPANVVSFTEVMLLLIAASVKFDMSMFFIAFIFSASKVLVLDVEVIDAPMMT